jgi:tRNA threonylcarbamoyl adenosine modification protein YjeE
MAKKKNLEWLDCSEPELRDRLAGILGDGFGPDTLVFLEGEMGAGKSTLARFVIEFLCPGAISHGSPTFPLVQTYRTPSGMSVYHIDLYRLRDPSELEDSGILEQFEERGCLVLVEWGSLFEQDLRIYRDHPEKIGKRSLQIQIDSNGGACRTYRISG